MKNRFLLKCVAVVSMMLATSAFAFDSLYVTGRFGSTLPFDTDGDNRLSRVKMGYQFSGSFGARMDIFRAEIEGGYFSAKQEFNEAVRASLFHLMANGFVDIPMNKVFCPYVGLGLGWGRATASRTFGLLNNDEPFNVFAYQGIVGASFHVNPNFAFTVDYRLMGTSKLDNTNIWFLINSFNLGLRGTFDI